MCAAKVLDEGGYVLISQGRGGQAGAEGRQRKRSEEGRQKRPCAGLRLGPAGWGGDKARAARPERKPERT